MNKAILIGNLANDPEYTQAGDVAKCSFRLAVQRRYTDSNGNRQADFLPVICWRGLAESCAKYLTKGRKCAVEGSIQTRSYDAQDGTKRYVTEIIADSVEFLSAAGTGDPGPTPPPEPGKPAGVGHPTVPPQQTGFTEVDDSELPF